MLYCSWYMVHDSCNYFSFWAIFWPFTPQTAQKMKIKKNKKIKKTPGDTIILHKCTKNHDYMIYCSWDMACDRCNCYCSFWAIFCPFTSLTVKKIKILKKWQKHLEISSFYTYVQKNMIRDDVWFLRNGAWRMDGWKKWHIEVAAPPKNAKHPFVDIVKEVWYNKFP